jgi:hypothetical protein
MKRRTLLAGLGASAAGSAILFGSGAFTQVEAERDLTIGVDEDSNALLALEAGTGVASVFADSGELVVDTSKLSDDDEGFGVNSTVQIGRTETDFGSEVIADLGEAAFKLTNNFDTVPGDDDGNNELDVAVNLEDLDDTGSDIEFIVSEYEGGGSSKDDADENYSVSGGSQLTINNLGSGDELYFAIRIDTASTTNPDDIRGDVVFRAGPNLANEFPTDAAEASDPVVNATQDTTHSNISNAIGSASPGDLIQLDSAGTFDSAVTIDKSLRLEGPNAGTSGVGRSSGSEATITGTLTITADSVTVDGVEVDIDGDTNGITVSEPVSDVTVQNSVINVTNSEDGSGNDDVAANGINVAFGDASAGDSAERLTIRDNDITTTVNTDGDFGTGGEATATGVRVNQKSADLSNVVIRGNRFDSDGDVSEGLGGSGEARGITFNVPGNNPPNNPVKDITIDSNNFSKIVGETATGIGLFESSDNHEKGPKDFTITSNEFTTIDSKVDESGFPNELDGSLFVGGYADLGTHVVEDNNFTSGRVARFGVSQGDYTPSNLSGDTEILQMEGNFYGASDGPSGNQGGTGSGTAVVAVDKNNDNEDVDIIDVGDDEFRSSEVPSAGPDN